MTAAPSAARTSVTPCASTIPDEGWGDGRRGRVVVLSNGAQGVKSDDQGGKNFRLCVAETVILRLCRSFETVQLERKKKSSSRSVT